MRHVLDNVLKASLVSICGFTVYDACSDAYMYIKAKSWIHQGLKSRPDVVETLNDTRAREEPGPLPEIGPWYDSSVVFSHQGMVATITVPCRGTKQASDVMIKAIRKGGMRSTLLYNLFGGDWDIMCMDAYLGMRGSSLLSVSLLDLYDTTDEDRKRDRVT